MATGMVSQLNDRTFCRNISLTTNHHNNCKNIVVQRGREPLIVCHSIIIGVLSGVDADDLQYHLSTLIPLLIVSQQHWRRKT